MERNLKTPGVRCVRAPARKRWSCQRRTTPAQMRESPGSSHRLRAASSTLRNFLTGIASLLQSELLPEGLRICLVLEANRVTLHPVQHLWCGNLHVHISVRIDSRLDTSKLERFTEP